MRRVMCVHFPTWPLQRIRQARPDLRDRAFAITRPHAGKGSKIVVCCSRADRAGVRPGMPAAEALAMLPRLTLVDEDLDADRAMLRRLAQESERYSPLVGLEEAIAPASLYMDVTGGADCFGGEAALVRQVRAEFQRQGWFVQVALADTPGAAWALTHFSPLPLGEGERGENLASLPVAALRLPAVTVALLGQLGVERIGQLAELPRSEVAVRFGSDVLVRLDQAFGRCAEVIEPYHAPPEAEASIRFEYPIEHWHALTTATNQLLVRLEAVLEKRGQGARLLECVLYQEDCLISNSSPTRGERRMLRIECSLSRPMRSANYLGKLLGAHLEKVRALGPIGAIRVRATVTERILDGQPGLFEGGREADRESWSQLLDSLASRLGEEAVTAAQLEPDPQPELACRYESALNPLTPGTSPTGGEGSRSPLALSPSPAGGEGSRSPFALCPSVARGRGENLVQRPLRLFPRPLPLEVVALDGIPVRFLLAGVEHAVQRCRGPERIETGWWRDADIHRDYFVIDTTDGTRWWAFRCLDHGRWFLHGCFD